MFGELFGNFKVRGIREITPPEPVSYVPQTLGWAILLALILLIGAFLAYRWIRRRQANLYRRFALERLEGIERDLQVATERVHALAAIPVLVKHTALQAFAREEAAPLSGDAWLEFLEKSCKDCDFSRGAGRLLPRIAYESEETLEKIPQEEVRELLALAGKWIRNHESSGRTRKTGWKKSHFHFGLTNRAGGEVQE